jgi:hypothetical protein
MQYATWTMFDAFPASQAGGIFNIIPGPGVETNIDPDRTIE